MSQKPTGPESGTPPLAKPFLHALTRMQDRTVASPEDMNRQAIALLTDRFGIAQAHVEATFAHGVLGLMSEHTHYFNGFAALMPVAHGSAVAARPNDVGISRCVFAAGEARELDFTSSDLSEAVLARLVQDLKPEGGVDLAVISSLPSWWWEVSLTSLGVAAARALQALFALPSDGGQLMHAVRDAIADALQMPFSMAYPVAADNGRPGSVVLVDTAEDEHLTLPEAESDALGWAAIHVDIEAESIRDAVRDRMQMAEEALATLQKKAFSQLTSFRDLEHRDLERALSMLPFKLAPIARYLVTENRRVQKLVAAVRRRDWQMMGALMVMSHAAQRDDWRMTSPEADHVVNQVEAMSLEGLYGARMSGRSGTVVLAGQPFVIPEFVDRVQSEVREQFGTPAESVLL